MIQWIDYLEVPGATEAEIDAEEIRAGHKFPQKLRELLAERQGQRMKGTTYQLDTDMVVGMRCLATCGYEDEECDIATLSEIAQSIGEEQGADLSHLVCFADTSGNGSWCLSYKIPDDCDEEPVPHGPVVVYVDRDYEVNDERAIIYVAPSFDEFWKRLEETAANSLSS